MCWEKNIPQGKKTEENMKSTPEIRTQIPEFIGGKGLRAKRNLASRRPSGLCWESSHVLARAPFCDTVAAIWLQTLSSAPLPKKPLISEVTATSSERWALIIEEFQPPEIKTPLIIHDDALNMYPSASCSLKALQIVNKVEEVRWD